MEGIKVYNWNIRDHGGLVVYCWITVNPFTPKESPFDE